MEQKPFMIKHRHEETLAEASIIKPNYPHHINCYGAWHALLLINPESEPAKMIDQCYLHNTDIYHTATTSTQCLKQSLAMFINTKHSASDAEQLITTLIAHFTGETSAAKAIEPRIQTVIDSINGPDGSLRPIKCFAEQVNLSPSRLSHLFSREMGLPLKQYLLWQKLYHAGFRIAKGELILEAAAAAGFSDAAHFTREFAKVFGLPPSKILKATESMHLISDSIFTR
ncbi:helix-turn-helix domain-containing protein [Oceanicoccus sagamiensis]|nr:helix-turn-helix domain-containing protein [Oceanicoccus sagamiensis]